MLERDRQVDAIVMAEWRDRMKLDVLLAQTRVNAGVPEVTATLQVAGTLGEGRSRPVGPNAQPALMRELLMNRLRQVSEPAA